MRTNPLAGRLAGLAAAILTTTLSVQGQIEWADSLDAALAKAKAEKRVVFIALNMDGERANDQMVNDHYKDPVLVKLSRESANLFCSTDDHAKSGRCPRCKGPSCSWHRTNDYQVRRQILKVEGDIAVVAPQHLFVGPDGEVISSASYFITKGELEWMWVQAIKKLRPDFVYKPSDRMRAPGQLKKGDVDKTEMKDKPPTPEEVEKALRDVKKMGPASSAVADWARLFRDVRAKSRILIRSENKKAMDWVKATLRSYDRLRGTMIEDIGNLSPKSWAPVIEEYLGDKVGSTRLNTVIALEKLANPKSVKALRKFAKDENDEDDEEILGRAYRAMAACGPTNRTVIKSVTKAAKSSKATLVRAHAVIGAGRLEDRKAIKQCLLAALKDKSPKVRSTAAYVIAIRQDEDMLTRLEKVAKFETDVLAGNWMRKAAAAVRSGDPSRLQGFLADVLDD